MLVVAGCWFAVSVAHAQGGLQVPKTAPAGQELRISGVSGDGLRVRSGERVQDQGRRHAGDHRRSLARCGALHRGGRREQRYVLRGGRCAGERCVPGASFARSRRQARRDQRHGLRSRQVQQHRVPADAGEVRTGSSGHAGGNPNRDEQAGRGVRAHGFRQEKRSGAIRCVRPEMRRSVAWCSRPLRIPATSA